MLLPTAPAGAEDGGTVQIRRTAYGIPHIVAEDFGGLGYGYGYAYAQDNVCLLAETVATVRGERSRFFGPRDGEAGSADGTAPGNGGPSGQEGPGEGPPYNLASDTYYSALRKDGTVRQLLRQKAPLGPSRDARELVAGYVDGFNRYLRDTGAAGLPDPQCKGKPWVRPVTQDDIWHILYDINGSSGAVPYAPAIGDAKPGQGGTDGTGSGGGGPARAEAAEGAPASNGWAVGREAMRPGAGNAMVLANPHLPWVGSSRFYQVQLTIPGSYDVAGAGLAGMPVVAIGHNERVAWAHTASDAQHATLYRLKLDPKDPARYLVDGRSERMRRTTVPVAVREADGSVRTVERTVYRSRFGAVLGLGWSKSTAYAVRDANASNLRSLDTWLAMGRASDLGELRSAQDRIQGIPWTYTQAADSGGTTYFTDSSAVPHLTDEQLKRCAVAGEEEALDGSTAACAWGSDPDALVPGVYGPAAQPKLTRGDFVANSNNGPRYTNPAAPLTGFPAVYDHGRLGPRAQLGLDMIAGRADGSDGLGAPGFDLGTLRASMLGNRVLSAEQGRADVVALCRERPRLRATDGSLVDVRKACAALGSWGGRAHPDRRGAALWTAFHELLLGQEESWAKVPYDPAEPLTTPRGIDVTRPVVGRTLADAVQMFAAEGLPADAPLGAVQRWAGIALPGCDGEQGCFNVMDAGPDSGTGSPVRGAFGTTFLMAVTLTDDGPRAATLLTYGQSANPRSPHYTDQTRLFARGRWVTERFTQEEILADPQLKVTTLRR